MLALVLGSGCSNPESRAYCTSLCAKLETCDSSTDELDCRESCEMDDAFAPAYWEAFDRCTGSLSCSDLSSELSDCVSDEARALPVSDTIGSLCSSMATKLRECDDSLDTSAAEEQCRLNGRLYSDAFGASLASCYAEPCDRIGACLATRADDFDVEGPLAVFAPDGAPSDDDAWAESHCRAAVACSTSGLDYETCLSGVFDAERSNEGIGCGDEFRAFYGCTGESFSCPGNPLPNEWSPGYTGPCEGVWNAFYACYSS